MPVSKWEAPPRKDDPDFHDYLQENHFILYELAINLLADLGYTLPPLDGTANQHMITDGAGIVTWDTLNACDVVRTPITATTMTVTTGVLDSGTVADTQVWQEGDFVSITEETGVPGYDVRFTFSNVTDFCFLGTSAYYDGTHYCEFQIYDDTNATWRVLWTFSSGSGFNYRFSDFPPPSADVADYINSSNEVIVRFYHPSSGNASHDLFIDYVSLVS